MSQRNAKRNAHLGDMEEQALLDEALVATQPTLLDQLNEEEECAGLHADAEPNDVGEPREQGRDPTQIGFLLRRESQPKRARPVAVERLPTVEIMVDPNEMVRLTTKELRNCKGPCRFVLLPRCSLSLKGKGEDKPFPDAFRKLLRLLFGSPWLRELDVKVDLAPACFVVLCDEVAKSTTLETLSLGKCLERKEDLGYPALENLFRENQSLVRATVEDTCHSDGWMLLRSAICHPKLQMITLMIV